MTKYRIVEENRQIWIERSSDGKSWDMVQYSNVPRYHATVADARSWVATLQKGRIIHSVEDAPNLPVDERKAEDDTSNGIKPLEWFLERVGMVIHNRIGGYSIGIKKESEASALYEGQNSNYTFRYSDVDPTRQ